MHDTRDLPYTYKSKGTMIPTVVGDFCPACGEVVLDAGESSRVSAAMLAVLHDARYRKPFVL